MGDGRYYTLLQFFNTLSLLVIVMVITVNLVRILYRHISQKISNGLIVLYALLLVSVLARLIEEVIVGEVWIHRMGLIGDGLLLISYIGIVGITMYLMSSNQLGESRKIKGYDFKELYTVVLVIVLSIIGYMLVHWLGIWPLDPYQLILYGLLAYVLEHLLRMVAPYDISENLFEKTKDMILDYVFIVDVNGTLIYKNNNSETSSYFKGLQKVDIGHITGMFNQSVDHQQLRGKDYFKYAGDDGPIYFSYGVKPLKGSRGEVGAIITFTDVTGLMNLLEDLDQQKKVSESLNNELQHYATIVYSLEKEREIQQLLEGIAVNQEASLMKLKEEILKTLEVKDGALYIADIDRMVIEAKDNLQDVRKAVNTFRAYYGGNDD